MGQAVSPEILSASGGQSWAERVDIKKVNRALAVGILLLMMAAVLSLFNKKEISLKQISAIPLDLASLTYTAPVVSYQPVTFYLAQVKKRDIFHPVPPKGALAVNKAPPPGTIFILSGIYMGQYPQAIITDKAEQKAYFLRVGEDIKGYKVKAIFKDKVILKQGDEEAELK